MADEITLVRDRDERRVTVATTTELYRLLAEGFRLDGPKPETVPVPGPTTEPIPVVTVHLTDEARATDAPSPPKGRK